ncbi:MAG: hypothetical protein OES24_10605 [Acidimicrobiia bacterium]|nr:hypothetical protein [Acidimicrobiia bacterium]
MPLVAIVTIVVALVICVALAYYLIRVVLILRAVNDSLGKITFGVRAIAHRTAPLGELLTPIKSDLEDVADAVEGAVESVRVTSAA